MIERDAEATRRRLVLAATAEFAEFGIAGSRVDRIAAAARSNKAQIYHYFGSKDGLFAAVFSGYVEAAVASEYFDADNLPETAGCIFDDFELHPEIGRLVLWYRLERGSDADTMAILVAANQAKVDAIVAAQQRGAVTSQFPAAVILGLMITLASAWNAVPAEFAIVERDTSVADRRRFVVDAVARLVAP